MLNEKLQNQIKQLNDTLITGSNVVSNTKTLRPKLKEKLKNLKKYMYSLLLQ